MKKKLTKWYGWQPDLPDHRDLKFTHALLELPPVVDLRPKCPPIYDQGNLGSCTGNAIAGAFEFVENEKGVAFTPSRLFIYYNERVMEGTVSEDAGAMIRDGIKSVNKLGTCDEVAWPYKIGKFAKKPPIRCFRAAKKHQVLSYQRISESLLDMRACLAQGTPFVFGFSVYESFESAQVAKTGVLSMPQRDEELLGGHAVVAVGYDFAQRMFIVRNSWGPDWGDNGYFYMPFDYITNPDLADDRWAIKVVE